VSSAAGELPVCGAGFWAEAPPNADGLFLFSKLGFAFEPH